MAKAFPSDVRPNTSGTSSSIAVTSFCPRISALRTAGYQKSHRNPASASGEDSRAVWVLVCNMVRTASLIAGIVVQRLLSQQPLLVQLRDLEFGAIVDTEQIDVRHVPLADSTFAPTPERR